MKHDITAAPDERRGLATRRRTGMALAACTLLALVGCASAPRVSIDRADEPMACASFGWLGSEGPAPLAEQRLRGEVMRQLAAKGYAVEAETPDCLVSGVIYTGARPGSPVSVGLGAGRWGGTFGTSVGVSVPVGGGSRVVGNLGIDVIHLERNSEIWRGTLDAAFRTPEPGAAEIATAVRRLLDEFPARAGG